MKKLFSLAVILSLTSLPAVAEDAVKDESSRLDRLERDLQVLHKKIYEGGQESREEAEPQSETSLTPTGSSAETGERISSLEQEIRRLTGKIEELEHRNGKLAADLDNFKQDVELRFTQNQQQPPAAPAKEEKSGKKTGVLKAPEAPAEEEPASPAPEQKKPSKSSSKSAKSEYDKAFARIEKSDYDGARKDFQEFIKKYPKDDLAGNAYFWVGESYFAKSDYEQAALQYLRGYKNFPDAKKAPDNLLKLAVTLGKIGKKNEACVSFRKFNEQFPNASSSLKQRAKAETSKLGCK